MPTLRLYLAAGARGSAAPYFGWPGLHLKTRRTARCKWAPPKPLEAPADRRTLRPFWPPARRTNASGRISRRPNQRPPLWAETISESDHSRAAKLAPAARVTSQRGRPVGWASFALARVQHWCCSLCQSQIQSRRPPI